MAHNEMSKNNPSSSNERVETGEAHEADRSKNVAEQGEFDKRNQESTEKSAIGDRGNKTSEGGSASNATGSERNQGAAADSR